MSTSRRRKLASRANGAKSKGPKTPEGKLRSSYNSIRHGLLAQTVVLHNENPDNFAEFLNQFVRRFQPLDDVEFGLIEEMAASQWRMRRAWATETEMMNQAIDRQPLATDIPGERARLAAAFRELAAAPDLALVHRYETRLHRVYARALRNLVILRRDLAESKQDVLAEPEEIKTCEANLVPVSDTPKTLPQPAPRPENSPPEDLAA